MYRNRTVSDKCSLLTALQKMDELDVKLLIVLNDGLYKGLISAGDIQRALINNKSLETPINDILRNQIRTAKKTDTKADVRRMMMAHRMELCPVLDEGNVVLDIYYWEDEFGDEKIQPSAFFDLPVVVMAGGSGTRLRPLTYVIPKPLIPIDDKTMLEHIFNRFNVYGCKRFYLSVNYKASFIRHFISEKKLPYDVRFIEEGKPLGTAGSLTLLKNKINQTFFVSNCDILIKEDYSEILKYHLDNNNELTVIAALKSYSIPYGTLETGDYGQLLSLSEKPDLTYKINSGMYILEPHLLNQIPDNEFFHITHLIEQIILRKGRVGVYPVSEKSWEDIGEWDSYIKQIGK